jgi:hypothetical protein
MFPGNHSKTFLEPPCNLKTYVPRTGKIITSVLRTFKNVTGQESYGFVPRTNGKRKSYVPTTVKEPNVLAGFVLKPYLLSWCMYSSVRVCIVGSKVAQRSKALYLSSRGVTTDPGSIPICITTGCDWESHRAAHNWPSVIQVRVWPG